MDVGSYIQEDENVSRTYLSYIKSLIQDLAHHKFNVHEELVSQYKFGSLNSGGLDSSFTLPQSARRKKVKEVARESIRRRKVSDTIRLDDVSWV